MTSRHGRSSVLAALAALCGVGLAGPLHAQEPNVTEVVVRFRDADAGSPSEMPTAAQFEAMSRSLRTGFAAWQPTLDAGFRLTLAPTLPFAKAREAVNRLRLDASVLYVTVGATDTPAPPRRAVSEKRGDAPDPPLSRIIVRYRDPTVAADAAADRPLSLQRLDELSTLAGQSLAHERPMAWASAYLVRLFQPLPREQVEAIAQAIARDPAVLWAQPDYIHQPQLTPNDPQFTSQWHYMTAPGENGGVNLPNAWNRTTGWSGVRTAVLDTGALFGHPDLANRFIGGWDFVSVIPPINPNDGGGRDSDPSDPGDNVDIGECTLFPPFNPPSPSSWHGTHVAGTVGAASNNTVGVAGVNWVSKIVPLRVLAKCGGSTSDIADALEWASGGFVFGTPTNPHPARLLNMSLGGHRDNQTCDMAIQTAVNNALGRNSVVVVAAGNLNEDASFASPANCNGVITVAAVGRIGQRASYSNHDLNNGSGLQVEIAAPGGSDGHAVLSTVNSGPAGPDPAGHTYGLKNGTSMAAPHVAGIVSLMLSLKPSQTPAQVLSTIVATARAFPTGTGRDCTSVIGSVTATVKYCGAGIINADAALNSILATGNGGGAMTVASATLSSTPNPVPAGATVTLTSQVTGTAPTGAVAFIDNESVIAGCGAIVPTGAGNTRTAVCMTSALNPGSHSIRAVFTPGNDSNTPADSPTIVQVVNPGGATPTTTQVTTGANPTAQSASVTFTATVTGFAPTGSVLFRSDGATISGCAAVTLTGSGDTRSAQCTTTSLSTGDHTIEGVYSGDAFNLTSSGVLGHSVYGPNACVVFNDIPSTDGFCPNVEWLYNRAITFGCVPAAYCPHDPVIRLAMASFMNREGGSLTPVDLPVAAGNFTPNLATPQVLCTTADHPASTFPRRAFVRARATLYSVTTVTRLSVEHVVSTNAGASWTAIPDSMMFQTLVDSSAPPDDKTLVPFGAIDLATGTAHRFGLRVTRVEGSGNPLVYCANFVQVRNRNAASSPR